MNLITPKNRTIVKKIKLTLGSGSKNGPMYRRTTTRKPQEITLANCVFPPTRCWIKLRDNDAATGKQQKNDPNMFAHPY